MPPPPIPFEMPIVALAMLSWTSPPSFPPVSFRECYPPPCSPSYLICATAENPPDTPADIDDDARDAPNDCPECEPMPPLESPVPPETPGPLIPPAVTPPGTGTGSFSDRLIPRLEPPMRAFVPFLPPSMSLFPGSLPVPSPGLESACYSCGTPCCSLILTPDP